MGKLAPLAAMLLVLPVSGARAELGPIRPEFKVSKGFEYYNEGKFSIDMGASAAGTFVVVWEDFYQEPNGPGIFARRFDPLGRPLGGEFHATPTPKTGYLQGSSHVASDAAGNFVVVWDEFGYLNAPGERDGLRIMAQRFDASGGGVGLPFQVNTLTIDDQWTPKAAFDGAGSFVVVWAHYYGTILAGQRYSSTGAPVGGQFQVNTDTSCCLGYTPAEDPGRFDDIDIAGDAAGNFVVAWKGQSGGDYPDIVARIFDGSGSVTGAFVVNTATTATAAYPAVASDQQGNFIIAWTEGYPGFRINARRYTSTGTPIGGDFRVNDDDDYVAERPSVAADASGRFVIVWREYDNHLHAVMGREFDSTGAPVGSPFRIDEPAAEGYSDNYIMRAPEVGASAAGEFVVVWGQYGAYQYGDYSSLDPGVVGRRLGQRAAPCSPTPLAGCRETTVAGSGVLNFKKSSNPARSRLTWRFARGPQATPQDFGDPFTTDSYSVCLYDGSASPQPLYDAAVPGNGACGTIPCWRELSGQRVAYFDVKAQFVNGITEIRLSPGNAGRSRAMVKGKGSRLVLPDTPLSAPVTLQLQGSHGECWTAEYGEFIRRNEGGVFKANPGGILP
jgi:hypothetical protein